MTDSKVTTLDDNNDAQDVQTAATPAPAAPAPARRAASRTTQKATDAAAVDAATETEAQPGAAAVGGSGRCLVTVHADKSETGRQPVFIGVNGFSYLLPRGTPCDVPTEVASALGDCMETIYDEGGAGREVQRYSFSVKHI